MSYSKQFPIRITIDCETYNDLINALTENEYAFEGRVSNEAEALREKIEKYGRREGEGDCAIYRLGFYESEGQHFIMQFLAASERVKKLQEDIDTLKEIIEINEALITEYGVLVELLREEQPCGEETAKEEAE